MQRYLSFCRLLAVSTTAILLAVSTAGAQMTVLAHYRLGEEDPGAVLEQPVTETVDDISFQGGDRTMTATGQVFYNGDTPDGIESSISTAIYNIPDELNGQLAREATPWHSLYPGFRVGMEAWLKVDDSAQGRKMTPFGEGSGYRLFIDEAGFYNANATGPSNDPVDWNNWQHVAWWTTGSFWQIYVNGEAQFDPLPNFTYGSPSGQATIGGTDRNADEGYFGLVDEFRIFTWTGPFDPADLGYFTQRKAGDVNEDGVVDVIDYDIWRMHVYEDLSGLELLEGRSLGDLNGDRQINLDDFAIIKENQTPGAAPIPEPTALILLVCGAAAFAFRARRGRGIDGGA